MTIGEWLLFLWAAMTTKPRPHRCPLCGADFEHRQALAHELDKFDDRP